MREHICNMYVSNTFCFFLFSRSQSQVSAGTAPVGDPRSRDLPVHHSFDEEWPHHADAHFHGCLPGRCTATGQHCPLYTGKSTSATRPVRSLSGVASPSSISVGHKPASFVKCARPTVVNFRQFSSLVL